MEKFGPFTNIVAIASALVATFGLLLLKMLGPTKKWAWLASDTPPFLVAAGPRILAVALMAVSYIAITPSNYQWFAVAAVLIGVFGFIIVSRFDRLRKRHVVSIPLVGKRGQQLVDKKKKPVFESVVIGTEAQMRPEAKAALDEARRKKGGLSLIQFMGGYGAQKVNDPGAIWDHDLLADISSKLTTYLMYIVLAAVMALFLGALVIDIVKL
jgi:hypothetical protein